jgi:hypothetical protein
MARVCAKEPALGTTPGFGTAQNVVRWQRFAQPHRCLGRREK